MSRSMTAKAHNMPAPRFARYRVEYDPLSSKHLVLDPDGRRVWGPGALALAEDKRDQLQAAVDTAAKRGPRACLSCGATFASEGIHNRMCTPCRGRGDALSGYGYARGGDGRRPSAPTAR